MKNLCFIALFWALQVHAQHPETGKFVWGKHAMVVSARAEASKIGTHIIKQGGNAFDAMVAVEFALAVCYPGAGNIGGGGFMVFRQNDGTTGCLDYREKAPFKASKNMYLDSTGEVMDDKIREGCLSSGVPGTVDAMLKVHKRFCTKTLTELIQPAIDLAKAGYILTKTDAINLNNARVSFVKNNRHQPAFIKPDYEDWHAGDTLQQLELAATLERIRDFGRAGFYEGETARMIVEEMQAAGGLIGFNDLQKYESIWRTPLTGEYKGYKIITMPPPSSGGVALLQLLGMIKTLEYSKCTWNCEYNVQAVVEAERRVYADRSLYLGDPDFSNIPVEEMLDERYLINRFTQYRRDQATPSNQVAPGRVAGWHESEETTHYSIVDDKGNAVSVTTTLNNNFGSRVVVKGAGFLLNNEMDDFSAKPGHENTYGLIGSKANAIAPQKRMLSSMTPTIVEDHGKLFMVLGTPGGSTIITTVFQVIMNVFEHQMNIKKAVDAPRFHHQWWPDEIKYEIGAFRHEETIRTMKSKGYKFVETQKIGRVDAILIKRNGLIEGAADYRGDDAACGW